MKISSCEAYSNLLYLDIDNRNMVNSHSNYDGSTSTDGSETEYLPSTSPDISSSDISVSPEIPPAKKIIISLQVCW